MVLSQPVGVLTDPLLIIYIVTSEEKLFRTYPYKGVVVGIGTRVLTIKRDSFQVRGDDVESWWKTTGVLREWVRRSVRKRFIYKQLTYLYDP